MPSSRTLQIRVSKLFRSIHPYHHFWGRVIAFFAWLWRFIGWIWSTLIVGGLLVGILISLATKGTSGLADPRTWVVIRPLLAHPFWTVVAFIASIVVTVLAKLAERSQHRAAHHTMDEYVMKRVDRLDPHLYIPYYVEQGYLGRRDVRFGSDADATAREVLHNAIEHADNLSMQRQLGICIFGRPAEGKTRLAWEAMRAAMANWTFVMWPHDKQHPLNFAALHKMNVVLWLDDIHKFANPNEASSLNDLPRRFAEADVSLVVVATCRDGDDEKQARKYLSNLLERLTEIRPADISLEEAARLEMTLKQIGVEVHSKQFDGTPGSLLLGITRMRDQRYPNLPKASQSVVKAMKLLRSARIYMYPASRVRAIAIDLFEFNRSDWREARDALVRESFVRPGIAVIGNERTLEPMADIYLEQAVPDYPISGSDITDDWPQLRESLTHQHEAACLNSLGIAFSELLLGDLRTNKLQAEACFRAALQVYTREHTPSEWAATQNNLGIVLCDRSQHEEGYLRADLLRQAFEAYQSALLVYTRKHAPEDWARTQNNLGIVLSAQAEMSKGKAGIDLLQQAVDAYCAALQVYSSEHIPFNWAGTQNNLGEAFRSLANLAEGEAHPELLQQAVDAYRAALTVWMQKLTPTEWAKSQHDLGETLYRLTEVPRVTSPTDLLRQAVEADQAALQVYSQKHTPMEWARTQNNLGIALFALAKLTDGKAHLELLQQAVEAYHAALQVHSQEHTPIDWGKTQNNLGVALRALANLTDGKARLELLQQSVHAYRAALKVYTQEHTPVDWGLTQFNLGNALSLQGELEEGIARTELLKQAGEAYRAVLRASTEEAPPIYWGAAQLNLGNTLRDLAHADGTVQVELLKQAVKAYSGALRIYTQEFTPFDCARIQFNLAQSYFTLASLEHDVATKCTTLQEADHCTDLALLIFTQEAFPRFYAQASELRILIKAATLQYACDPKRER